MSIRLDQIFRIIFCTVLILSVVKYCTRRDRNNEKITKTRRSSVGVSRFPPPLPNLKNRNVFYNRIEKCGSRSLVAIAMNIAGKNGIRVFSDNKVYKRLLQKDEILELQHNITSLSPPTFYERHVFYIDFDMFLGNTKPIYINVLRDPIERFVSHFNYGKYGDEGRKIPPVFPNRGDINECIMKELKICNRAHIMMFNMGTYLCGMKDICRKISRERVELAKKHIDENYAIIGMAEEFNATLLLLEWMLPRYFRGATEIWNRKHETLNTTRTIKRDSLTDESRKKLREVQMKHEYEVYDHAKKKFARLKTMYGIG